MNRRRALFLDFDGVIHPTADGLDGAAATVRTPLFGWLPTLSRLLMPHADVLIVVHSTWRYTHNDEELRALLGALGPRVGGATPRGPRYDSIQWWLHMNPTFCDHRILDDDAREFPHPPPPELVLCDPSIGISAPEVQAVLRRWLES